MDAQNVNPENEPRPALADDLLFLCRNLNAAGAKYVVVGGWAIIQHGFARTTTDIDILIDTSRENFEKVKEAMLKLPDGAIREVAPGDLDEFVVVRVGDEVVVDLMKSACGIDYGEAIKDLSIITMRDVTIPFASPRLLWRMKQTHRAKDAQDLLFLEELFREQADSQPRRR